MFSKFNRQFYGYCAVALYTSIGCTPINVSAQPQTQADDNHDEIIVTAQGRPQTLTQVPVSISRLDGDDISALEAIRIGEVLGAAPGVFFSGLNGPREIAQIRQPLAFDNRTLFLEDGVPLQSSIFFDQSALGYSLALNNPQAIEVLRGPGTALYGSDAFNGVINILTTQPPASSRGFAQARYGAFGLYDLNAAFGGAISGNADHGHRAQLSISYSGEEGFRDETAFNRLQFVVQHSFTAQTLAIDSLITHTNYETESATSIPFADFLTGSRESGLSALIDPEAAIEEGTYFRAQSKIRYQPSEVLSVQITPYLRRQDIAATATFQPATAPRTDARVDSFGVLSRLYGDWHTNSQTVFGVDLELTDFSRFTFQDAPDTVVFGSLFRQGVQFDYTVQYRGLAPYLQHEQRFGRFNLQLGLRYDTIRYDFENALIEVPGDARLQAEDRIDRFSAFSPKAAVSVDLSNEQQLFARYARGFRIPRESDLYELEEGQDNFSLTPETIDSGEVGWRYTTPRFTADLVGYWSVSRDGIITDVQTAAGNISINAGSSRFAGLEASAKLVLWHTVRAEASFAFQDFRFIRRAANGPDPFDGNLISEAPRTIGQVSLYWQPDFAPGLNTNLRVRHIGRWALNDANSLFTDNEFIVSAFLRYELTRRLSLDLRIENLTDALYPVFADAPVFAPAGRARPGAPRTISGGIKLAF